MTMKTSDARTTSGTGHHHHRHDAVGGHLAIDDLVGHHPEQGEEAGVPAEQEAERPRQQRQLIEEDPHDGEGRTAAEPTQDCRRRSQREVAGRRRRGGRGGGRSGAGGAARAADAEPAGPARSESVIFRPPPTP